MVDTFGGAGGALPSLDNVTQKASYDSTTAGHVNTIFQSILYAQYNQETNFLSVLPQRNRFDHGGVDGSVTATAFRTLDNPVSLQTAAEGGSVPSGVVADIDEVDYDPKRSMNVVKVSDVQSVLSSIEDAVGMDDLWPEVAESQLKLGIDREALADAVVAGGDQYEAVDTPTSLDRAIASGDEEANATDENGDAYDDGDFDYGTVDRSNVSFGDAYVDYEQNAQGSNNTRQLTEDLFTTFLTDFNQQADVNPYEDCVILTGTDSAQVLSDLAADRSGVRNVVNVNEIEDQMGTEQINDAETMYGLDTSGRARAFDGIPIVDNQHAPVHASGTLSGVFLIPVTEMSPKGADETVPRISIENLREPTPYIERAGHQQEQGYLSLGEFNEEALIRFDHEVVIRDFSSCGKLRDLSE